MQTGKKITLRGLISWLHFDNRHKEPICSLGITIEYLKDEKKYLEDLTLKIKLDKN
jgi:hypothetical protein